MLGSIPQERLDLVEDLKERYQVLLLSNTNAIHVPAFTEIVRRENPSPTSRGFPRRLLQLRAGPSEAGQEGLRSCSERHGADPAATLFIDDSIQHAEGARKAGLRRAPGVGP